MSSTTDQHSDTAPNLPATNRDSHPDASRATPESASSADTRQAEASTSSGSAAQSTPTPTENDGPQFHKAKNEAQDINQSTILQATGNIHYHNSSVETVDRLFGSVKALVVDLVSLGIKPHRKPKHTNISTLQTTQQPPPENEQTYAEHFERLSNEDKLFVTLLRLLPDITWVNFWDIYDAAESVLPKPPKPKKHNNDGDDDDDDETTSPPLIRPRFRSETYWVNIAHITVKQINKIYIEGKSSQTTINFATDEIRGIIERSLSTYHRQWLFRLAPVLCALGEHSYFVIRQTAAKAAAVLADIDWDDVENRIINLWSLDDKPNTRAAVAHLLDTVYENGKNDGHVIALLEHWSIPGTHFFWRQSWTAANAWKLIGLRRFDIATKHLRELAHLADNILDKYCKDPKNSDKIKLDNIEKADLKLMSEIPAIVTSTLIYLSVEGKLQDIIIMIQDWTENPIERINYIYRDYIIIRTIFGISSATFDLKQENSDIQSDFFVSLQDNKDIRKYLANILAYIIPRGPEYRQSIRELLEILIIQFSDLGLLTEPVGRVMVNIFRRLDTTNRERFLQMLSSMIKHKHSAVRTRSADVLHLLRSANYPPFSPEENAPKDSTSNSRIVFGKQ